MSIKNIEYISLLLNNASKILIKKVDADMTFLNSITDNPQFLSKKIDEIKATLMCHSDLLTLGHLLSIEYLKYEGDKTNFGEILSLLESIKVPFKYFDNLFKSMKGDDIGKLYKEFTKVSDTIKTEISDNYKGGCGTCEFAHSKVVLGGNTYISDYRSEMLLFDLTDKNKYNLSEDELNFILKDLLRTDDIDTAIIYLKDNFNIKTIVSMFKIDELLNIQLDKYKLLEKDIEQYFVKQKNKYIQEFDDKPIKIEGAEDIYNIVINSHLQELVELDIKCVESIITKYIIDITNIKSEDELQQMSNTLLDMIDNPEYLAKYKYRKSLKIKIQTLHESLTNMLLDKHLTSKIPAVFPTNKSEILQFLITSVTNLLPELKQTEKIYDECAIILAEIIDAWSIIIGPSTESCIMHAINIMKLHIGSTLLGIIATKKYNNDKLSNMMISVANRTEKNILGTINLREIYNNKFEWDNISYNISTFLQT